MTTGAIRSVVRSFIGHALSLLGFAGIVGVATQAHANVERERAALEKRVEIAREALRGSARDNALYPLDEGGRTDPVAQRSKRTWNNWPNWNNWANWFNR